MSMNPLDPNQAYSPQPGQAPAAGLGQAGDPSQGPMPGMLGTPYGVGGPQADPATQAVWDQFPSTDPKVIADIMARSGGDMQLALHLLEQYKIKDQVAFEQRQDAIVAQLQQMLMMPQAAPQQALQGPAVGGVGTGA